jgi:pyruvate dehydrogenase E2 component (dihydrolipoamide acetyltransferase)
LQKKEDYMAVDIVMPNLGFDTQSGRLIEWLKQPGESVAKGDILAVVESDKANVELESIASGILLELIVPANTEVAVGAVIARVGSAQEATQASSDKTPPAPTALASAGAVSDISPVAKRLADNHGIDLTRVAGTGPGGRIMRGDVEALIRTPATDNGRLLALPKVRKAAREAQIDLWMVTPTGSRGQVTMADLERYRASVSAAPAAAPVPTAAPPPASVGDGVREVPLTRARKTIGERLGKSMREAPHFYVSGEFDVEAAMTKLPGKTRINDLIQYLTVQALVRAPELNATYEHDRLYAHDHINLGIAVALEEGLLTPVLRHAERYSLQGIADESRALIERARDKRLRPEDLQGGTFTVSNLGVVRQVERFTAVINPPQVAILAVGTVKPRPVVIDGGLHIRHTVYITLSGDHRAVDGMHLARFMAAFQEQLDAFAK